MRKIMAMIRKEFLQVFRDKPMLVIIFIVPLVQLLVLSFAMTTDVRHVKLLIADLDNSSVSRRLVQGFLHTDRFDFAGATSDLKEIGNAMRGWKAQLALVIPPHFQRDLERNLNPHIQLVADGVDGNTAGVALGYARGILTNLGERLLQDSRSLVRLTGLHLAVMEERMWYNPDLDSQQFMVPAIVVVLLTILPMMLSAMSLVKEKEIGTLEQLMVTPLKKHQLLLGKLIPFLILSFVDMTLVMAVAVLVFKIAMNGSYWLLAGLSFLYLFTTLGLGILISTLAHSQQQAMFIAWFFMIFMILMGGFFIPIENMPLILQRITYLNPMRYFISIVRGIFQKGSSLQYLWNEVIPMAVFGMAIFSFSVVKFQKRVK